MSHNPLEVPPGTVLIGTYEIQAHLNTGGMGEVYRGINIHNDEVVAIKIVLPALAHDQKILSLFQKESTVLRRIAHDAIVRYEVFTIDPGIARPCLIMEYVEGPSLSDRIEHGALPAEAVLVLLRRLASGLEVAHQNGVVHRDLSPDNVILCDNDVARAKIIDFGIAKASTPGGRTLIGGQFAGKPGYVAPEQLGLGDGAVTGRADIYSLGLLAAAAALGYPLNMGDTPAAAVMARMAVPDLAGIDPVLVPLLTWMLQPDAANRPAHMADIRDWIDAQIGPEVSPDPRARAVTRPPAGFTQTRQPVSEGPVSRGPVSAPPISQPPISVVPVGRQTTLAPGVSPPQPRTILQATILDERPMLQPVAPPSLAAAPAFMPAAPGSDFDTPFETTTQDGVGTAPHLDPVSIPPDTAPDQYSGFVPADSSLPQDAPPQSASPFGPAPTPQQPVQATPRAAEPVKKRGALGLMAGVVVLGLGAGGAFMAGVFTPADQRPVGGNPESPVAEPLAGATAAPAVTVSQPVTPPEPPAPPVVATQDPLPQDAGPQEAGPQDGETQDNGAAISPSVPESAEVTPDPKGTVAQGAAVQPTPAPQIQSVIPNPQDWLRAAVADTPSEVCLWVGPQQVGAQQVIVYGTASATLDRLRQQFQDQFGQPLALSLSPTAQGQCPALVVIRALERARPDRDAGRIQLEMPQAIAAQQDGLTGQILTPNPRHLSVLLVDPLGRIQNISALAEAGQFALSANRLRLPDAAQASLFATSDPSLLLIAIDSAAPLPIVGQIPANAILPAPQAAQFWSYLHRTLDALPEAAYYATAVVRWQR